MKQRAFVVMPFGKEVAIPGIGKSNGAASQRQPIMVNFDRVYDELLKPALEKAGCEAVRADSEVGAGDIRSDMFFELVTADVVVADLSIYNPNVYYELGVRDAVCPRGVFIVQGGWPTPRPFDVAQDRSFNYNGKLFTLAHGGSEHASPEQSKDDIQNAVDQLAAILGSALASEAQVTGSPVYSHLPGLEPANWEHIDTSRSRYFGSLQHDWQERVLRAQELNHPGDILTIAQDAPTRIHRCQILWKAARALIGMCQFSAAKEVLNDIIDLHPEDIDAQLYLGIIYALSNDTLRAERQLQAILKKHQDNPKVGLTLGFVYRLLWYLEWKDAPNPRERAKKSNRLLLSAIRSFYDVQRDHPEQFLAGYNALLLMAVAEDLFPGIQLPTPLFNRAEFTTVMHYLARSGRQTAEKTGDYDMQFWSAVALAGLELLKDSKERTLCALRDACAVPSATRFYLQLLQERIEFLRRLEFKPKITKAAAELVKENLHPKPLPKPWGKVVVYYGYPCDPSAGPKGRFPRSAVKAVRGHINEILKRWKISKGDLAICAGASEGDVIFAERCLELGARVRLLILEPTADELAAAFGDPFSREWASRSASLLDHSNTEAWYHRTELGEPVHSTYLKPRHNWWIFNTARMEAQNAPEDAADDARFYGLILSDGSPKVTGPEEPAFFAPLILASNNHQGRVEEIDLRHLGS